MLQLTGNFSDCVCFFTSDFGAVSDEFFSNRLIRYFCAANMNNDGYWHLWSDFVAAPVHRRYDSVRDIACFVVEQRDFVCETINYEAAAFWYSAAVSNCHFNNKWVTCISRWFALVNDKVLGVQLFLYAGFKQF